MTRRTDVVFGLEIYTAALVFMCVAILGYAIANVADAIRETHAAKQQQEPPHAKP